MIFLVSKDPFSALQLQNHLRLAGLSQVEIYLSIEEAEHNLYKLPDLVLAENNLSFSKLLYLTLSVKQYDAHMQVIWLCQKDSTQLHKLYKSYGVAHCISKSEVLLEEMMAKVHETLQEGNNKRNSSKRVEFLKKNFLRPKP